ncbi:MAG TPA: hypothetical protein VKE22_02020 [Haliangiales bacterium]|nr:hypothetical protein [Haliangiales bacterium]
MVTASKQTVIELLILAFGETELRDMGLDAMRGVLRSDPRLAVLDNALDLGPVWELLSGQPDFRPEPATAAILFVKSLEGRLGIALKLPDELAELSEVDVVRAAEKVRPKRAAVDKILAARTVEEVPTSGAMPPRPKGEPGPLWAPSPPRKPRFRIPRRAILVGAAVVVVASAAWMTIYLMTNTARTPQFQSIDLGFASGIPLKDAGIWSAEVHATLGDAGWLARPAEEKKAALASAVARLHARHPEVRALVVKDGAHGVRATAQWVDKGPPVVRLY